MSQDGRQRHRASREKEDTTRTRPRPRALLLDLDGTILDHDGASRTAILATLEASGLPHDADPMVPQARWRALEAEHFQRYLDGELDFEEQRLIRTQKFLASFGRTEADPMELLRWFDRYRAFYERAWCAFDDVRPFLEGIEALDGAPLLAVVTNGDQNQQASKLVSLRLERLELYTSSALGARKPDRAIFVRVCEALDIEPAEAWFVGDDREADALGAEHAGLTGIWLDRGGDADRRARPARATSLLDVLTWIRTTR